MFKPVLLVPTYNHYKQLHSIVTEAAKNGLTTIIVDDGSDEVTKAGLQKIALIDGVVTVTLQHNSGKGGAVKAGLRHAQKLGYSHCIQVDADGQHDLDDLPQILSLSKDNPSAVILGNPVYDKKNTPKARLFGRKITTFWIAVETLSLDIKDGLCGYRAYPLDKIIPTLNRYKTGNRMDFDPEIVVKLKWEGCRFINFSTKVRYVDEESSNFQMVRDNLRISFVFMRLFWVALFKLFSGRRTHHQKSSADWFKIQERGSRLGIRVSFLMYKIFGSTLTMMLLQPVLLYFYLTDSGGRRASLQYLEKVYKAGSKKISLRPGFISSYIHYNNFALSLLDKIGLRISSKIKNFKTTTIGFNAVEDILREKKGAIFFGAHFGNFDVLNIYANRDSTINVRPLMYRKHAQMINRLFKDINSNEGEEIIELESITISTASLLTEHTDNGGFLGILADRVGANAADRYVTVPFFGQNARLPQGPWIIANLLKCPVFFVYAARTQKESYELFFEKIVDTVSIRSKSRELDIGKYAELYIKRLESACKKYPYQWFNFYDFWST